MTERGHKERFEDLLLLKQDLLQLRSLVNVMIQRVDKAMDRGLGPGLRLPHFILDQSEPRQGRFTWAKKGKVLAHPKYYQVKQPRPLVMGLMPIIDKDMPTISNHRLMTTQKS